MITLFPNQPKQNTDKMSKKKPEKEIVMPEQHIGKEPIDPVKEKRIQDLIRKSSAKGKWA